MELANRNKVIAFAVSVYILAVLASINILVLKRDALQFHTRDYNYFIEQAARLTDYNLSNRFSLNIEGYNMLGLQGIEGVRNLFHAIHTEYFRYTYVILYGIFRNTLPLYIFYSLLFFLPILYYTFIPRARDGKDWLPVVLFIILYVLFPATLNSVSDDLRPRILFISAWTLAVLAVYYDRPFLEKLLFFGLLLAIREEGILLGAVVIVLDYVRMAGKPARLEQTLIFVFLDLIAIVAFAIFMSWGEFTRIDAVYDPRLILRSIFDTYLKYTFTAGLGVLLLILYFWNKKRERFNDFLFVLVYLSAIVLTGAQTARDTFWWYREMNLTTPPTGWELYIQVVTKPTISLVFYIAILLLALLWDLTNGVWRNVLGWTMAALGLIFAATTLIYAPGQVTLWNQNLEPARLVWDFVESHDHYNTNVLVDYETYQAFYNYEYVLVYNRLPVWLIAPQKRFYPQNKEALVRLIKKRVAYVVISRGSYEDVSELAAKAEIPLVEMASNDQYLILKLQKDISETP